MGNLTDFFSAGSTSVLVQAVRAELQSRITVSGQTPTQILTCNITPQYADSIIEITGVLQHTGNHVNSWGVYKDGYAIYAMTGNLNDTTLQHTNYGAPTTSTTNYGNQMVSPYAAYDTAGSTNQITYSLRYTTSWSTSSYTAYVGNRSDNDMLGKTFMFIKEIRP
jgi:hypothetical protein